MPRKRPTDTNPTMTSTPKKPKSTPTESTSSASPNAIKKSWTNSEEKKFLEAIDRLAKSNLWAELKGDPEVGLRGANGVRSHWEALYKRMNKG